MSTNVRIRGRELQRIRTRYQHANPLCVLCQAKGIVRAWTELDHIVPLGPAGGADTDDNRQGLCALCHDLKTRLEMGYRERVSIGADGWPTRGGD